MLRSVSRTYFAITLLGLLFCLPFFMPSLFLEPMQFSPGIKELPWLSLVAVIYLCWRDLPVQEGQKGYWIYFCFALALLTCFYHGIYVDEGSLFEGLTNREVQMNLHKAILQHNPSGIPHAYRFLPDSLLALINYWMNDFRSATSLYRLTFQFLIFYFLLKWALQFVARSSSALLVLMFYALIYPISVRNYAGQMTDPMSHLSFILALYFAQVKEFKWFCLALFFGVLAKESVFIMVPIYCFLNLEEKSSQRNGILLGTALLAVLVAVRIFVLHAAPSGVDISGVGSDHWLENLWGNKSAWVPGMSYLILIWLPLGFRGSFENKKPLAIIFGYLFVAIFISSMFFSWIREFRNFVPAIFVLALMMTLRWEKA